MDTKPNDHFIEKIGRISDDGVAAYDPALRRFTYANDNFLHIFGLKRETLFEEANPIRKLVYAEDVDYLISRFNELIKIGHINTTEFRLNFENGVKHLSCDVLMPDDPKLIIAFVKDISEAKKHEDYIIKYTAQKDTMLDMLTHNLGGPLMLSKDVITVIQEKYQGESRNGNGGKQLGKLINIIQENTQHCIDIVNDFLRKEHVESVQTYVRRTRFDVLEKIRVTLDKLIEMNADKIFVLSTQLKNVNINSDAVKFFQVLHNLLSNAIKFTPENGTIEIKVTDAGSGYLICVADNGIGVPEELKPKLFKENVRGREGLKGEKSFGMGLSITRKLVTLMGGKICFESEEGRGTAFYVELPKE